MRFFTRRRTDRAQMRMRHRNSPMRVALWCGAR